MSIVVGLDPGTNSTGYCIIDTRGSAPQPIACTFLAGGSVESNGSALTGLFMSLRGLGTDIGDATVAIEILAGIAYAPKGGGIVASLIASSRIAGLIAGLVYGRARIFEMTAREWRGHVLRKPQASDQEIARVIPGLVHGWPKRSSVHVRDAAGVAIACAWVGGRA